MNKKLIKTIASITCGLGIASSIPFIATSCGNNGNSHAVEQLRLENFTTENVGYWSRFEFEVKDVCKLKLYVKNFNTVAIDPNNYYASMSINENWSTLIGPVESGDAFKLTSFETNLLDQENNIYELSAVITTLRSLEDIIGTDIDDFSANVTLKLNLFNKDGTQYIVMDSAGKDSFDFTINISC